jgi:hypothetical protein
MMIGAKNKLAQEKIPMDHIRRWKLFHQHPLANHPQECPLLVQKHMSWTKS